LRFVLYHIVDVGTWYNIPILGIKEHQMKLDRMISILMILVNRRRVQARELAERFEVSLRTIYRDIAALKVIIGICMLFVAKRRPFAFLS